MPRDYLAKTMSDAAELQALVPEWLGLYGAASGLAAQHPAFTLAALEALSPGDSVRVIAVRKANELVGLWPLCVSRRRGVRAARHPGCGGGEEYAGALIAPTEDGLAIARAAVAEARGFADLMTVANAEPSSPLLAALRSDTKCRLGWSTQSHVVDLAGFDSWQAWLGSKSKNFRQGLGGQRRNLAKLGELASVEGEAGILPWFFAEKRRWLHAGALHSAWLEDPALGESFLTALARQPATPLRTFGLKLDGRYIAAGICFVSCRRLEYLATVYLQEGEIARFSPGMLVSEDCGRYAQAHGLDLDFRFMDVPYKERWRSRIDRFDSITAALTPRGVAPVLWAASRRRGKALRRAIGRIVRGGFRGRASAPS